jgi:hypothetical protein
MMINNKYIIITSIFEPTEAVKEFAKMSDYELIVVGDKKSPAHYVCKNVTFLNVEQQNQMDNNLIKILPYNHYCRKMIGYLVAIQNGADYIVDTDDDNIPKQKWSFPDFVGEYDFLPSDIGFVNIYQLYTKQKIWPRGLPLKLINKQFDLENKLSEKKCNIGIWQGLADEDPDVDAIYRLTSDIPCNFSERRPVVLGKGTICPYNTQNTMIRKELFPLMYLPTYVTFRFTDILRGLISQPIMWLMGYHLGFTNATVIQKRNPHDYFKDFLSEIPMYQYCEKVVEVVAAVISNNNNIYDNMHQAYCSLHTEGIVCKEEIYMLEAWIKDLQNSKMYNV